MNSKQVDSILKNAEILEFYIIVPHTYHFAPKALVKLMIFVFLTSTDVVDFVSIV